ncbi:hypothetical protein KJ671_01735 [Patescibacteria group bacterium]|nr:hypothetical protein [Patescibacteria group bacterium]
MAQHQTLAEGRWQKFSLADQLGNIGSEISRAIKWQDRDKKIFYRTVDRALELFDLTLDDPRWIGRRQEIARTREVFCDIIFGDKKYNTTLADLLCYFDQFAYFARLIPNDSIIKDS